MVEGAGTIKELGLVCFNGQLHLDNHRIFVHDVQKDIFGSALQPVFNLDNAEESVIEVAYSLNFIIYGDYLIFI